MLLADSYSNAILNFKKKKVWADLASPYIDEEILVRFCVHVGHKRTARTANIPKGWRDAHAAKLDNLSANMMKAFWGNTVKDHGTATENFIKLKLNMWWRSWYTTPPLGNLYIRH